MLLNYSFSKSFPFIILLPLLYRKKLRAREYMYVICSRSSSLEMAEEEFKFCSVLKLLAFSIRRELMCVNSKWSRADSSRMDWALNTVGSEDWESLPAWLDRLSSCWFSVGRVQAGDPTALNWEWLSSELFKAKCRMDFQICLKHHCRSHRHASWPNLQLFERFPLEHSPVSTRVLITCNLLSSVPVWSLFQPMVWHLSFTGSFTVTLPPLYFQIPILKTH